MIGILLIGSVPLVGWATDDKAQADQTATVNPPVKKTRARLPDTEPATVLCSDGDSEGDTEKAESTVCHRSSRMVLTRKAKRTALSATLHCSLVRRFGRFSSQNRSIVDADRSARPEVASRFDALVPQ
jgi:hypothetical protein